jgi:peroxisomal enoyl-CoA hydratase 2
MTNTKAFKFTTQEVIDFYAKSGSKPIPGVPKFDPRRIVDGQRMMQFLKPLPPTSEGKTFVLKSKVIGVYDKGKAGSVLETESLIMDKDTGEVCLKSYTRAERLPQLPCEKNMAC